MAFNGNCSPKPLNIALLLEKKQMLTRLSKFSIEFPQLEGFGLITRVNVHSHTQITSAKLHASSTIYYNIYYY